MTSQWLIVFFCGLWRDVVWCVVKSAVCLSYVNPILSTNHHKNKTFIHHHSTTTTTTTWIDCKHMFFYIPTTSSCCPCINCNNSNNNNNKNNDDSILEISAESSSTFTKNRYLLSIANSNRSMCLYHRFYCPWDIPFQTQLIRLVLQNEKMEYINFLS